MNAKLLVALCVGLIAYNAHSQPFFEGEIFYKFDFQDSSHNANTARVMKLVQPELFKMFVKGKNLKLVNYLDQDWQQNEPRSVIWKKSKMYQLDDLNKTILSSKDNDDTKVYSLVLSTLPSREILGYLCDLYIETTKDATSYFWIAKELKTNATENKGLAISDFGIVLESKTEMQDLVFSYQAWKVVPYKVTENVFRLPFNYESIQMSFPKSAIIDLIRKNTPESLQKEYK
jgi:hypothetical protein